MPSLWQKLHASSCSRAARAHVWKNSVSSCLASVCGELFLEVVFGWMGRAVYSPGGLCTAHYFRFRMTLHIFCEQVP